MNTASSNHFYIGYPRSGAYSIGQESTQLDRRVCSWRTGHEEEKNHITHVPSILLSKFQNTRRDRAG